LLVRLAKGMGLRVPRVVWRGRDIGLLEGREGWMSFMCVFGVRYGC
jgi:hypothetical protein